MHSINSSLRTVALLVSIRSFVCRLEEMSDVHRAHAHERDDLESRAESCDSSIEQMEGSSASLEERYQFFQEMRGYVRDLVECLNEKVGEHACGLCGLGRAGVIGD